jgi:hypothetical protein
MPVVARHELAAMAADKRKRAKPVSLGLKDEIKVIERLRDA